MSLTPFELSALELSLRVGIASVLCSLPLGLAAAWLLARCRFPGKTLVDGVIHLPLVLPPVVVGYALLSLFGRRGIVGAWLFDKLGVSLAFNWKGAALASAVMAFPLLVRAIRLSLEAVDRRLEAAALTLGAGRLRVFLTVTLPLTAPGLLAGAILAFARSIGEFGATISFVSNLPGLTQTLPLAFFSLIQQPGGEAAAARLTVISIMLSLAALVASELLARRIARKLGSAT
ncbi:MAG TPA: molybdate ABC transporter permease subunit [Stellaceae bacterium]|jgi:molybdate transport system permease protein|nr:molybdate ABC transporter permease subunit [Stellaceae bacterium]